MEYPHFVHFLPLAVSKNVFSLQLGHSFPANCSPPFQINAFKYPGTPASRVSSSHK